MTNELLLNRSDVAPPAFTPVVSLAEARAQLRNEDTNFDDNYILGLIAAATTFLENRYNMAIAAREIVETFSEFKLGTIKLGVQPFVSMVSVAYTAKDATAPTVLPTTEYGTILKGRAGLVYLLPGKTVPTLAAIPAPIQVRYNAGWPTAADVPAPVKVAILLMITDFYENRENPVRNMPTAAEQIMEPYYQY